MTKGDAEMYRRSLDMNINLIWGGVELPPKAKEFADMLAQGASEHRPALDQIIVKYAANWELHRMAAIDRNLLRLASYELLHHADTPISVVIDEAVEIAKSFSTLDSGKFVNGILDKIKLETVVPNHLLEQAIEVIVSTGRTGEVGDGKIFLVPVADAVRVRTGERGVTAIS